MNFQLLWISSLAYPTCFGLKGLVVVGRARLVRTMHFLTLLIIIIVLEPDKNVPSPLLYHLGFIVGLVRGAFQLGIRARRSRVRASDTHIPLCVIIPTYKSPTVGLT
jgi:hypothetical protein